MNKQQFPIFLILIFLTQPVLSQKYFDTEHFKNIPYYTEAQDVNFDSLTNTYFACFSSREFSDNYYINPYNTLICYDTAGNILKQRSWTPFIQDTILKIEIITHYRDSILLIGNMKANNLNYLFTANTDTGLNIYNLKYYSFPHNDSNFVYYSRFDTTHSNYNYLFFHRTFHYSSPVGKYTTPFVIKLSKANLDSIKQYQITKDFVSPTLTPLTYAYTVAEFCLNDSTFKTAFFRKWDSINLAGQPQSSYIYSDYLFIANLDSNFVYKHLEAVQVWDTSHFQTTFYSIASNVIPAMMPLNSQDYIFCNQMNFSNTLWSPTNYFIGLFVVDKITDTVKKWKRFPAYPGNPYDSLSAMHTISKRKALSKFDNNHYYLVGSQGKDGEAIFIYSLDSNFNIRWSRFIEKDSIRSFRVESVSINYRGEILIASYGDLDSSNFDYPVILKIDSTGNFPVNTNNFENSITSITLYPNPAKSQLLIKSTLNLDGAKMHIYNLEGKILSQQILTYPESTIQVSELKEGIYLFEIIKDHKSIMRCKFLKE